LAFGENTAFHGFGQRISEADDLSTKSWLATHLLDEAKHTEGFSRLLDYFYPSYRNQQNKLFSSNDALVFYGHTHRCNSLIEWLICTQIAEVFGRYCYKGLHASLSDDPIAEKFLKNIIVDEARHISYISELIDSRRINIDDTDWNDNIRPFVEKMIRLGRNMFEAKKKGKNFHALSSLDIDVTGFCDTAQKELSEKYL
jgi:rubrerythrin